MNENDKINQSYIDKDYATMLENGSSTKRWVAAGPSPCVDCEVNSVQGFVDVKAPFASGHLKPLAHAECHCYIEGGEIDLDSIGIWNKE